MNNEIKEILDYLSDDSKSFIICGVSYYKISDYKSKVLLDYITNLQEENKNLKDEQISKYQTLKELQEENERLKVELNKYKAKQKLENDIKMQQSYLDYYRTMTRGDK